MTNNEASNPSVAIPGAGSGLGRELALKLADKGYRVFGTALNPAEVDDLATASGGRYCGMERTSLSCSRLAAR